MKTISIGTIEGIGDNCELREPTLKQIRPFMAAMSTDTQAFMMDLLTIAVYCNGEQVQNIDEKIGLSTMMQLVPELTELMGFEDDTEGKS